MSGNDKRPTPLTSKRILLKISGECMSGKGKTGFCSDTINFIAREIKDTIFWLHHGLPIIIGGGNIVRGYQLVEDLGIDKVSADTAGMLATITNAIILQSVLEKRHGIKTIVMSSVDMNSFAEPWINRKALSHLCKRRVVIIAAGIGEPRCSTDFAAVIRALEISADMIIKGTKVNGIYTSDPAINKRAKIIRTISHGEFMKRGLGVVDRDAIEKAETENLPIKIFNIFTPGNLNTIVTGKGENIGSLISTA